MTGLQRGHGECDGGVGLTRARGTDGEKQVVGSSRFHESGLVRRAGLDGSAAGRKQDDVAGIGAEGAGTVAGGIEGEHRVDVLLGQVAVAIENDDQLVDDRLYTVNGLSFTLQDEVVPPCRNLRIGKGCFDLAQMDVVESVQKKRFGAFYSQFFVRQRVSYIRFRSGWKLVFETAENHLRFARRCRYVGQKKPRTDVSAHTARCRCGARFHRED